MKIQVKRLNDEQPLPVYAHDGDAGLDLLASDSVELLPGQRTAVPTGLAVAIPEGYAGFVHPRSGRALREGLGVVNAPGLIDSGYRGEIKVILVNHDPKVSIKIECGDKIAQLVIQPVELADLEEVDELPDTNRGSGGFGSTGR